MGRYLATVVSGCISQIANLDDLATSHRCQWFTMLAAALKLRIIVQDDMTAPFADVPARPLDHRYWAVQANDLSHSTGLGARNCTAIEPLLGC